MTRDGDSPVHGSVPPVAVSCRLEQVDNCLLLNGSDEVNDVLLSDVIRNVIHQCLVSTW